MRGSSRLIAAVAAALLAGPAAAQEVDVAVVAQEVHERRCASVAADHASLAAAGMAEVANAWAEVEAQAADTAEPHLSYWSGLLAQCLNRPEEAGESFRLFLAQTRGETGYDAMAADARNRMLHLGLPPPGEGSGDAGSSVLAEAKSALLDLCGADAGVVGPDALSQLSRLWSALTRIGDSKMTRQERFARGRLAFCLGQQEHGVADLRALSMPGSGVRGDPPGPWFARKALAERDVFLDRNAEFVSPKGHQRRLFIQKKRMEVWVGGGLVAGGTSTYTTLYVGLEMDPELVDPIWWDDGRTGGWSEVRPSAGVAPTASFGLMGWAEFEPQTPLPQFGMGAFLSLRAESFAVRGWRAEADLECVASHSSGACIRSRMSGLRMGDEADVLADEIGARIVLGPEIALRIAPEQPVSVTVHLVGPAFDFPTGYPQTWCAKSTLAEEGIATKWQSDVSLEAWDDQTEQYGRDMNMQTNVGWSSLTDLEIEDEPACSYQVGGPAPLMVTARAGISVTARPAPFLSLGARLDVQPLPLNAARGLGDPFPTGTVHDAAWTHVGPSRPVAVPVLIDLQAQASVTF